MRKYVKYLGVAGVFVGCLLLVLSFLLGWTEVNVVQFLALLLIVAGIVVHVVCLKRNDRY